jgi:hypothetical protein
LQEITVTPKIIVQLIGAINNVSVATDALLASINQLDTDVTAAVTKIKGIAVTVQTAVDALATSTKASVDAADAQLKAVLP